MYLYKPLRVMLEILNLNIKLFDILLDNIRIRF